MWCEGIAGRYVIPLVWCASNRRVPVEVKERTDAFQKARGGVSNVSEDGVEGHCYRSPRGVVVL